jgi:hypothetical protein
MKFGNKTNRRNFETISRPKNKLKIQGINLKRKKLFTTNQRGGRTYFL